MPLSDGGGQREDASSIVVLDGLMADGERAALLAWLTAQDWDGSGDDPPGDKWERNCVDHNDVDESPVSSTWGLQEHMVQACGAHSPAQGQASSYCEWGYFAWCC